MKRWLETQGYVLVWTLALRKGRVARWLHDRWSGFWYRHYCPCPIASSGGWTARACIRAGNCGCNNHPTGIQ